MRSQAERVPLAEPAVVPTRGAVPERLQSVDGLRGLAALAVVLLHGANPDAWLEIGGPILGPLWQVVQHGGLGVSLFFVISGFCIHQRWARQQATSIAATVSFTQFWRRRLWRLYPPYLAALGFSMSLVVLRYARGMELSYPSADPIWLVKDFAVHALMLHGLLPAYDYQGGNTVYWTLAREEYLYALYFPLLALRARAGPLRATACVLLIGLLLPPLAAAMPTPQASGWTIALAYGVGSPRSAVTLWIQWCLGLLAVEQYFGMAPAPRWSRRLGIVPLWVLAALGTSRLGLAVLVPAAWGMAFFTLLNWAVANEWRLRESAAWNALARIGVFSYSLYLVHLPTIEVLHEIERLVRRALALEGVAATTMYQLVLWVTSVTVACLAGRAFFRLAERPFLTRSSADPER